MPRTCMPSSACVSDCERSRLRWALAGRFEGQCLGRPLPPGTARRRASVSQAGWVAPVDERALRPLERRMKPRLKVLHMVHELDYGGMERLLGGILRPIPHLPFGNYTLTLRGLRPAPPGLTPYA